MKYTSKSLANVLAELAEIEATEQYNGPKICGHLDTVRAHPWDSLKDGQDQFEDHVVGWIWRACGKLGLQVTVCDNQDYFVARITNWKDVLVRNDGDTLAEALASTYLIVIKEIAYGQGNSS